MWLLYLFLVALIYYFLIRKEYSTPTSQKDRVVEAPPNDLVKYGAFNYGTYNAPINNLNFLDAQTHWNGFRILKDFRLKEWIAIQFTNDRFHICVSLFNIKLVALSLVVIYDRKTKKLITKEKQVPSWSFKMFDRWGDWKSFHKSQNYNLSIEYSISDSKFGVNFDISGDSTSPSISGNLTMNGVKSIPLVCVIPFPGKNRAMYTHKDILPAEGEITIGNDRFPFGKESFSHIDLHKGFYLRRMKWNWAEGGGYNSDGKLIGFNLCDNQSSDSSRFNENAIWVDGVCSILPPVKFFFPNDRNSNQIWHIRDAEDQVRVSFRLEIDRQMIENKWIIKNNYWGPFGVFSGYIKDEFGNKHVIDGYFGFTEDFDLTA